MMSEGNRLDRRGFLKGLLIGLGLGLGLLKDKQKSEFIGSGNDERWKKHLVLARVRVIEIF